MSRRIIQAPLAETPAVDLRDTSVGTMTAGSVTSAAGQFYTWTSAGLSMGFSSALGATTDGTSARWFPAADLNWSDVETIYVETEWDVQARMPYLQLLIGGDAGATFTNYINTVALGSGTTKTQLRMVFAVRLSECTKVGSAGTNLRSFLSAIKKIEFRLRTGTDVAQPNSMRVLRIWTRRARPKCVISYDNIFSSVHSIAYGAATSTGWRAAGLKGNMFMSETDLADAATSMTAAQVQEIYDAGWDMGLQNSDDSNSVYCNKPASGGLTSSGTTATWVNMSNIPHLLTVGDSITITGADQSAYNGTFTVATTPNAYTFTYTMAGAAAASPATGSLITCRRPGFDSAALVAADVAKSRAMANTYGWTRGNRFFSYSNGLYSRDVAQWMDAAGIDLTRTAEAGANLQAKGFDLRLDDPLARHTLPCIIMDNRTAAQVLADVDAAVKLGSSMILLGHGVKTAGDSLHMATSEFEVLVAGVKARVNQGLMDVVTMTQLWQQMSGVRA